MMETGRHLDAWEQDNQPRLRKLATLLAQLRAAVVRFRGANCVATYEPGSKTATIEIGRSGSGERAVPNECIKGLWLSASRAGKEE